MVPVTWPLVEAELSEWEDEVNSLDGEDLMFPEALAEVHCRFEQIHPFLDGNGRAGRLILNLILVRLGYPPVVIYKRDRSRYLKALRQADSGSVSPLGEMLARAVLGSLYRFVLPAVAGPARLVPLEALATPELGSAALRAAAGRGRLQATRGADGRWPQFTRLAGRVHQLAVPQVFIDSGIRTQRRGRLRVEVATGLIPDSGQRQACDGLRARSR